ncbi:hypothetical protein JTB14_032521 [Gonioctena quinquepunctata]|nr:hypothetical protein JTB14_032521 [Gonioctena quinquepunctata]
MDNNNIRRNERNKNSAKGDSDSSCNRKEYVRKERKKTTKCEVRVRETHDETLDLRNSRPKTVKSSRISPGKSPGPPTFKREGALSKPIHYNRKFDVATNIIAERIVTQQLKLLQSKKSTATKQIPTASYVAVRINKLVAQRILDVNGTLPAKLQASAPKNEVKKKVTKVIMETSTLIGYSTSGKMSEYGSNSRCGSPLTPRKPSTSWGSDASIETNSGEGVFQLENASGERSLPRFLSSIDQIPRMTNVSIQVDLRREFCHSDTTQTDILTPMISIITRDTPECITENKKIQTDMRKQSDIQNSPIYRSEYTNTVSQYSSCDQPCQMFEYLSRSDMLCLDWINKNLFEVKMNLNNIVIDERIRELSEFGTRSTSIC